MKNLKIKSFVGIFLGISLVLFFIIAYFRGEEENSLLVFIKILPTVVSIDLAIFGLFATWGWKWCLFRGWLVHFANLNGTWIGHVKSDWIDPSTRKTVSLIPVMLTIKQTFLSISCVALTAEMKSRSYAESFVIDEERQLKALAYFATKNTIPSIRHRNTPHDTAVFLEIIEKPKRKLEGRYWTEKHTTGELHFSFHCKKLLEKLPDDIGEHPVLKNEQI